jgi:hypothetical protein
MDNIIITSYAADKAGELTDEQRNLVRNWGNSKADQALRRRSLLIDFEAVRDTSRWTCVRRKQPFVVKYAHTLDIIASGKTLTAALARANKIIKEMQG